MPDGVPLPVSQFSAAKLRDCLLLLPKLFTPDDDPELAKDPAYPRARDLFRILAASCQLDPALAEVLPEPIRSKRPPRGASDDSAPRKRRNRRGRRGRRGRGPRKQDDAVQDEAVQDEQKPGSEDA